MNHLFNPDNCPRVAVIILNWNGAKLLREYLPEVIANTPANLARIIVADNGSTDDSLSLLAREFPSVEVIQFPENYGFAEGYNRALDATRYPITVLLNSDAAPAPDWITPLTDYLDAHPDVAAVQPKLRARLQPHMFEYAGAAGGFIDRNGYPYCRGRIFDVCEPDNGQYDTPCQIFWASGAALTVRTDLYLACGGLDPKFFAHMEEIDLCCRVIRAGKRVCAISDSMVFHLGGASLEQGNPKKTYLNFRNNLLLLHKNLPRGEGRRKLFWRRLADSLAFGMYLIKGDIPNAKAVIKAHGDFRRMRRQYTDLPAESFWKRVPGTRKSAIASRYLLGKKRLKP